MISNLDDRQHDEAAASTSREESAEGTGSWRRHDNSATAATGASVADDIRAVVRRALV